MRRREPAPGAFEERCDVREVVCLGLEMLAERAAVDELHRDEHTSLVLTDVEDTNDVRVCELRHRACLSKQ